MAGGSTRWRGRSVISKVVVLLDAFTPDRPELSLGELAEITGLPMSTTYRLASELVEWGGLQRADGGSGYRIGRRMGELGALAPHSTALPDLAAPFLRDLQAATGQRVLLAVPDGHEALCIEVLEPAGAAAETTPAEVGTRLPLHATAAGKVLLAHAPPELLDELLAAGLKSYTPRTVVAPDRLRRALTQVRRSGIASAREELSLGDQSVAAPVRAAGRAPVAATVPGEPEARGPAERSPVERGLIRRDTVAGGSVAAGAVVAAVAVVVRSGRGDARRFAPAVRTAAASISRSLGRSAPLPVR